MRYGLISPEEIVQRCESEAISMGFRVPVLLADINTVTGVDWSYSTEKVLTLSKKVGGAFTAEQVQLIEKGLKFQTSANATQGDRTFTVAHQDVTGNTGTSVATETVAVDTEAPGAI
ncbi:MAG: hypothetical protein EBU80_12275, partial [Chitinophagia bacterium]|nr:hypothetical protein [Chitinophagia bacterium]